MTTFLIVAALLAAIALVLVLRPLLLEARPAETRASKDMQLYRDQLEEVDRDLARGVINPEEADGARTEISRRLLQAAGQAETTSGYGAAPQNMSRMLMILTLAAAPLIAGAVYISEGTPGQPDLPLAERIGENALAERPSQVEAERAYQAELEAESTERPSGGQDQQTAALITQLETVVASRPTDIEGRRLLANTYMQLERFGDAWRLYAEITALMGDNATAEIYASQAEGMVLATGGYVSPEAEQVLAQALTRDPSLHSARYYAGMALAQAGRLDEAIAIWERLARETPPDAPWAGWLNTMLARAYEMRGGGPSAPAANPQDIEAMIARLEARLTSEGGIPEEWAVLMNSYFGIGRPEEAQRVLNLARVALGPQAVQPLEEMAAARLRGADGPGPTSEDIEAASQISPAERQAMINDMVDRLETRLTSDGGEVEEWLRLMNAYLRLGKPEEARRIYDLARDAVPTESEAGFLREQALILGIIAQ